MLTMTTVAISAYNVANRPTIGGHFWVYMQYAHGLRRLGYDVVWLEGYRPDDRQTPAGAVATFFRRMDRFGLDGKAILYECAGSNGDGALRFAGTTPADAEALIDRADLLLNFHYAIDASLVRRFPRTALVDIDPGLLQHWIRGGQLQLAPHDVYLTTGETVGKPGTRIPDCGLPWIGIRPPVCLDLWPYNHDPACPRFTTVSTWLGGEYVTEGRGERKRVLYQNDKRLSFLRFAELPARTSSELELAIYLKGQLDAPDKELLERNGWRVRHALDVARTPDRYRDYIQASRGEFGCAKPSCIQFQNAWVSDRTLCYLASGKPVVVQDTGPSSFLPNGEGMFRFSTLEEAAGALAAIEANYERHCRAARAIAEAFFDSDSVLSDMLNRIDAAPAGRRANRGTAGSGLVTTETQGQGAR
jgi:glycosyltransferase involved in cell wall biosynthesis